MEDIIKTLYTVSFDGTKYYLFRADYFYRNENECIILTGIISSPTTLSFELPGGYWLKEKLPIFNGESHYISKEQYEMAYNIADSISESIIANESLMYNGGTSNYDNQAYAIIRCQTNAPLSLYYEKKCNHWYQIGQNYNDNAFTFYKHPLRVKTDMDEEPIYIDELFGEGDKLIRLLKNGVHSLFVLLSEMYQLK